MRNLSQNTSLSCFHLDYFFNSLFKNKQIKKVKFLEKTTMKGKFQICIIVNIQWDTIKNVDVMFGSISHVILLGLRDYPSVVVLMKMPYLVNMTIWLPILNDKWQMISFGDDFKIRRKIKETIKHLRAIPNNFIEIIFYDYYIGRILTLRIFVVQIRFVF